MILSIHFGDENTWAAVGGLGIRDRGRSKDDRAGPGGVARNHIARLNSDGTTDLSFDPNVNAIVYSMASQADGKILIAGEFTTVGGTGRNRIARLNANGSLDSSFNPNAKNTHIEGDGMRAAAVTQSYKFPPPPPPPPAMTANVGGSGVTNGAN